MDTPRSSARGMLTRYRYPLLIALALLCVGAVALHAATSQPGAEAPAASAPTVTSSTPPGLTWNQPSLSPSVVAGAAATTTSISFTATGKLPNATVQLSPNLAGLVSVSPTNLGTVIQGQTVMLTLTVSAPASSTPAVMQGSIQVQKQQNPPLEVYGSALPVALAINWPSVATSIVTVNLPPSLVSQGAVVGQPLTTSGSDGATYIDLPLSTVGNVPVNTVRIAVYDNSAHQSLNDWFEQNIDTNGVLLQSSSYASATFPNGITALVNSAPFPTSYTGPLVNGYAYLLSPKGSYIASITLGQDTAYLYQLGYTTPAAIDSLLSSITSNLTFNE